MSKCWCIKYYTCAISRRSIVQIPRVTSPALVSWILWNKFPHDSRNSFPLPLIPSRLFSWDEAIVIAAADTKPAVTGNDMNSTRKPDRKLKLKKALILYWAIALETGISLHRGSPSGEPGEGLVCRGLWELDEEALGMGYCSLKRLRGGGLVEGSFTGEPERWGFREICKMPCKRTSVYIGALLGNL